MLHTETQAVVDLFTRMEINGDELTERQIAFEIGLPYQTKQEQARLYRRVYRAQQHVRSNYGINIERRNNKPNEDTYYRADGNASMNAANARHRKARKATKRGAVTIKNLDVNTLDPRRLGEMQIKQIQFHLMEAASGRPFERRLTQLQQANAKLRVQPSLEELTRTIAPDLQARAEALRKQREQQKQREQAT